MNKNLLLIIVGVVVVAVLATVGTLIGTGALAATVGIPLISGTVTLVLGALLALLDPNPPPPAVAAVAAVETAAETKVTPPA